MSHNITKIADPVIILPFDGSNVRRTPGHAETPGYNSSTCFLVLLLGHHLKMINFNCKNCGQHLKVPDQSAGKKAKCPKCNSPLLIPSPPAPSPQKPSLIKFRCPTCAQKIGLTADYAGKRVKCARCKNPLRVPQPDAISAPPPVTDQTAVLRAGHEQPPPEQTVWQDVDNLGELLLQETKAPSVGRPPDNIPTAYALADAEPDHHVPQLPHPTAPPKPKKKNPLIIIPACVLSLIIVGALLWHLIPDSQQLDIESQFDLTEVRQFADDYIDLLEDRDIDRAVELLDPDLQTDAVRENLEKFAERIRKGPITELKCTTTHYEALPDGNRFYFRYRIAYEKDYQRLILSLREAEDQLTVDAITIRHILDGTASIGAHSYDDLSQKIYAAKSKKILPMFFGFFCGISIAIIVIAIIQVAAMWVLFDKAGQPPWASIIPFYNMWVLAEIADLPGWVGALACIAPFIPKVGGLLDLVLWAVISINVARAFDRSILFGIGLTILPFIFYPVLAFSN